MNKTIILGLFLGMFMAFPAAGQFFEPEEETTSTESAVNETGLLSPERTELIEEPLKLRGQISAFDFVQPETHIWLEAPTESWQIVAPSSVELRRLGWTSQSVFVGEVVEVEVVRLLGAENIASLKKLTRANGALLLTELNAESRDPQSFSEIPDGLYRMDTKQAHLQFKFDHMGFSKTSVKIERLTGTVLWNSLVPQDSIIQMDMDASSLRSGITELDEALRGSDFFDFLNHPKISFNSTSIRISKWGEITVNGQLSIIGQSQPVLLRASLNKVGMNELTRDTTVGINFVGELNRTDWGLSDYLPIISDKVTIEFEGEFILTTPEPPRQFGTPINSTLNGSDSSGMSVPR